MRTPFPTFVLVSTLVHGLAGLALAASLTGMLFPSPSDSGPLRVELDIAAGSMAESRPLQTQRWIAPKMAKPRVPAFPGSADTTKTAEYTGAPTSDDPENAHQEHSIAADSFPESNATERQIGSGRQQLHNYLTARVARDFHYPEIARLRGWQGNVQLSFQVAPDGELQQIQVEHGSGFAVLDKSALDSLTRIARVSDAIPWLNSQPLDMQFVIEYRLTEQ